MLVLDPVFEILLQVIWLAALALGFLGTASLSQMRGVGEGDERVSGFQAHSISESLEGLINSFLEISSRLPDSVGQGGAGQNRVGQSGQGRVVWGWL